MWRPRTTRRSGSRGLRAIAASNATNWVQRRAETPVKRLVETQRPVSFRQPMFDNALFLLQIAVIVGFSRLTAALFRRFSQPPVVGEMAAGVALGPTLFGVLAPNAYRALFSPQS